MDQYIIIGVCVVGIIVAIILAFKFEGKPDKFGFKSMMVNILGSEDDEDNDDDDGDDYDFFDDFDEFD